MLRLISTLGSPNSDATYDFDLAVIELTIPRIEHWLNLMNTATRQQLQHQSFFAMEFWDGTPDYCTVPVNGFDALFGELWNDCYEGKMWNLEPESFNPPTYQAQRTEMERIKVLPNELWWIAYPKHGDVLVTTAPVRRDDMYEFLRRLQGKHMDEG